MGLFKKIQKYSISGFPDEACHFATFNKFRKEKIFYIYIKTRPDGRPFWVGKGISYRAFATEGRNSYYNKIVKKYGLSNINTIIFPIGDEQATFLEEQRLIAYFRALGCKLANLTAGGEGTFGLSSRLKGRSLSIAHREKLSIVSKGKPLSEDHCKSISVSKKGLPLSEDHCRNISKAKKSKFYSSQARENMSKGKEGKPLSEQHKQNISKGNLGKQKSQKHRENISNSKKGKPQSLEQIEARARSLMGKIPWNKGRKIGPQTQQKEKNRLSILDIKENRIQSSDKSTLN